MLDGPKEAVMDLVWHPTMPVIVSCTTNGVLFIWAKTYMQSWSAYAPDFIELEENEEYIEREDEFDIEEEKEHPDETPVEPEDEPVDILADEQRIDLSSESEDELLFIPTELYSDNRLGF